MKIRSLSKKQIILFGLILLAVLAAAGSYFLNRTPGYENGIHVRFEEALTPEQELAILAQYDGAVLLDADAPVLHDYTLAFPRLSEHRVKELVSSLCRTEGVLDASYLRVVSLSD